MVDKERTDALCPLNNFEPCRQDCMFCITFVMIDDEGVDCQIYCSINGLYSELRALNERLENE